MKKNYKLGIAVLMKKFFSHFLKDFIISEITSNITIWIVAILKEVIFNFIGFC